MKRIGSLLQGAEMHFHDASLHDMPEAITRGIYISIPTLLTLEPETTVSHAYLPAVTVMLLLCCRHPDRGTVQAEGIPLQAQKHFFLASLHRS